MTRIIGLAFFLVIAGCGGDDTTTSAGGDMATKGGGGAGGGADMALLSSCGHPGDTGNSIGVGKFCKTIGDCTTPGLKTTLCSAIGNGATPSAGDTYFCTIYPCTPVPDGGTSTQCGDNATCVCASAGGNSGCACTPDSCK